MKNIFVATDFSKASVNAGKYAVELAKHFKARLFLFNAYTEPVEIPESYFFYTVNQVGEKAMELLGKEEQIINNYGLVPIEKLSVAGEAIHTILSEAKKVNAELIVCGIKGHGRTLTRILGSTASALARKTSIPLIMVPENMRIYLPNNLLFASDMKTLPNHQNIEILKDLGSAFNSKLSIVSVMDDGWKDTYRVREWYSNFMDELITLQPRFETIPGSAIAAVLEKYIEQNLINMIIMMPHEHSLLSRILGESVTKQMAYLSNIPLLILPQKNDSQQQKNTMQGEASNS